MFHITGASIPGSDHTMPGKPGWKNNQDAFYTYTCEDFTVGIVADGCGSGRNSEVGSQIGVTLLGEILKTELERCLEYGHVSFNKWERVRMKLLGNLSTLANSMGPSLSETIKQYFQFCIMGFIIMPETTTIFHCGDGHYSINDEITTVGPYPDNAPPYIVYSLLGDTEEKFETYEIPTNSIGTISVGSDGVEYIPDFENELTTWKSTESIFQNPDALRRKLAILGRERLNKGILAAGLLKDDTTLVLARNPKLKEES